MPRPSSRSGCPAAQPRIHRHARRCREAADIGRGQLREHQRLAERIEADRTIERGLRQRAGRPQGRKQ